MTHISMHVALEMYHADNMIKCINDYINPPSYRRSHKWISISAQRQQEADTISRLHPDARSVHTRATRRCEQDVHGHRQCINGYRL